MRLAASILVASVLAIRPAIAQDLHCRGVGVVDPGPNGILASLELAKPRGSTWQFVHARVNDDGVKTGTLSVQGDVLAVAVPALGATFTGTIASSGTVIRGSLEHSGRRVPLTIRCVADPTPETDRSSHGVRMVRVQDGVQLEVLDWGGTGRPVVLIQGLNQTAHDFDDFAPKLAAAYHVYGITRRGHGHSSTPDSGYDADRLGDDVLAVMDSLHIDRPILIGHSMGGVELSSVGSRFPARVAGLVYLDAAYPYAYVAPARRVAWEKDLADDSEHCPCSVTELMQKGGRTYTQLSSPILAIYAVGPDWDTRTYGTSFPDWTPAVQSKEFETGVPSARVVRLENARHDVYRSNEADVLRAIHAFVSTLKP